MGWPTRRQRGLCLSDGGSPRLCSNPLETSGTCSSKAVIKPCGRAESFAMLGSWLAPKPLIMNRFGLNYNRH